MIFNLSNYYNNRVKRIAKKYNFFYQDLEKNSNKNIFVLNNDSSKGLLKLKKKGRSILERLNCHIRFKNELNVYEDIKIKELQNFKIPDLMKSDRETFLLVEFLPKRRPDINNHEHIIKALLEFQFQSVNQNYSLANIFLQPVFRCYLMGLKLLFKKKINPITFKSLVVAIVKLSLSHKKIEANYVHGDFHIGNLMQLNNGQLAIYDFENVVKVKKWIYIDIARLARSNNAIFSFSNEIIIQYKLLLNKNFDHITKNINDKLQLRFAFIYIALDALLKPSLNQMHDSTKKLLVSTLLNTENYDQWYYDNFEKF